MRPEIIRYTPSKSSRFPFGARVSFDRTALGLSFGARGRWGILILIPLETESHWLRRHQRKHAAFAGRVLPR